MNNLDIAQSAKLLPINEIAKRAGLAEEEYEPLGRYKAKLTNEGISRLTTADTGKLILVTAISPTPAGEGKTTTSIGLADGLNTVGSTAVAAIREPSLGPVFGIKGGACGGGYSQILPMEEINLFFNGDFPAITTAHNLLSAMADSSIHFGNPHGIDTTKIWWPRTMDMVDRSLREIVVGLGDGNGPVRSGGFVITAASEIMAALGLARSLEDLVSRLKRIIVGLRRDGTPVTAEDVSAAGPMSVLLKDALRPNLVQTMAGHPALVHGGPFGNIAHGCSSILGTKCGLGMADFVVTEAGFGSDLGGEKFLNILSPQLGKLPDAIVLVATVRALTHSGNGDLQHGLANLGAHIKHVMQYGPPVVVAINRFAHDTDRDVETVRAYAEVFGCKAVACDPWGGGGEGCTDLAELVRDETSKESTFETIYQWSDSIPHKLEKLCQRVYGGIGVQFSKAAKRRLDWIEKHGDSELPVCVAKTQYSLSDDASLLGAPSGFDLNVRDLEVRAGAGFIVAVCGDVMLMPGMGKVPAAANIFLDENGVIQGLR
ncbi:MAG TPA: formate--tetrahydrofolate ligase [Fimbriimonadaceae bacterium]|jgi:formate--tetrahydrofolate ligase